MRTTVRPSKRASTDRNVIRWHCAWLDGCGRWIYTHSCLHTASRCPFPFHLCSYFHFTVFTFRSLLSVVTFRPLCIPRRFCFHALFLFCFVCTYPRFFIDALTMVYAGAFHWSIRKFYIKYTPRQSMKGQSLPFAICHSPFAIRMQTFVYTYLFALLLATLSIVIVIVAAVLAIVIAAYLLLSPPIRYFIRIY